MTVDGVGDGREDVDVIFSSGGEITADASEVMSAFEGAETAGDFLLNFEHTQILFGPVV